MPSIKDEERIVNTARIIMEKGVDFKTALTLIKHNTELISVPNNELRSKLYLITNNKIIYAFLYVENNNYIWSIYQNGEFGPFVKDDNYIIEMIIESVEKYAKVASLNNQTLEEKIREFDRINQNKYGYHLK